MITTQYTEGKSSDEWGAIVDSSIQTENGQISIDSNSLKVIIDSLCRLLRKETLIDNNGCLLKYIFSKLFGIMSESRISLILLSRMVPLRNAVKIIESLTQAHIHDFLDLPQGGKIKNLMGSMQCPTGVILKSKDYKIAMH